jgi:hypothetical protein
LKLEVFDYLLDGPQEHPEVTEQFFAATGMDATEFPYSKFDLPEDEKVAWVNEHKLALRALLQWWGTDYRRNQNPSYWIMQAILRIKGLLAQGKSIVMDDCRFDNEMEVITNFGGYHIYIETPDAERLARERSGGAENGIANHASEQLLDPDDPRHSAVVVNDGSLDDLYYSIKALVKLYGS